MYNLVGPSFYELPRSFFYTNSLILSFVNRLQVDAQLFVCMFMQMREGGLGAVWNPLRFSSFLFISIFILHIFFSSSKPSAFPCISAFYIPSLEKENIRWQWGFEKK